MTSLQGPAQPPGGGVGGQRWPTARDIPAVTNKAKAAVIRRALGRPGLTKDPRRLVPQVWTAQVSTRISTTWSSSPRSDLQLGLGDGAAAEARASSPSPWPDVPATMPVSTASRS